MGAQRQPLSEQAWWQRPLQGRLQAQRACDRGRKKKNTHEGGGEGGLGGEGGGGGLGGEGGAGGGRGGRGAAGGAVGSESNPGAGGGAMYLRSQRGWRFAGYPSAAGQKNRAGHRAPSTPSPRPARCRTAEAAAETNQAPAPSLCQFELAPRQALKAAAPPEARHSRPPHDGAKGRHATTPHLSRALLG